MILRKIFNGAVIRIFRKLIRAPQGYTLNLFKLGGNKHGQHLD